MVEDIRKFLKITYSCKSCRKKFTKRLAVDAKQNFSIDQLSKQVFKYPEQLKICSKCSAADFNIEYSFYHREKLTN